MNEKLQKLADYLSSIDVDAAAAVYKLAGRHDKNKIKSPIKSQPAYKYIMYMKLIRNVPDDVFHKMKRQYLDTSQAIQSECQEELDKIVLEDALSQKIPSSTIRQNFYKLLSEFEVKDWDTYFLTNGSETRRG